jgi:hypothetical protein
MIEFISLTGLNRMLSGEYTLLGSNGGTYKAVKDRFASYESDNPKILP